MSLTGMPRPLKFNSLNQFVLATSNNFDQSYRSKSPKNGVFVIRKQQSLYDRYNINNLLLQKVNSNHLQILTKNIVLNQEDINPQKLLNQTKSNSKNMMQTLQPSHNPKQNNLLQSNLTGVNYQQPQFNTTKKPTPHTSQGFYIPQQKASKQYSQNELLFNFNKMAQQKKAKKKQFLDTIQAKLNFIQQQAKQIEQCNFQQEINIQQIQNIKNQMNKQLTSNAFASKITQKINQNIINDDEEQEYQKPKSLHINMSPIEINHVLNTHFDQNQKLLDQIIRVKSKSKEKSYTSNNTKNQWNQSPSKNKQFQKTAQSQKFNKTSLSHGKNTGFPTQTQKKIISATMKLPPKHNKK